MSKKLISITSWSKDNNDGCGIFSRESYSIFLWKHDKCKKLVTHSPSCPIPLISVNKGATSTQSMTAFLAGRPKEMSELIDARNGDDIFSNAAQQPAAELMLLPEGHTVRHYVGNEMKLCTITDNQKKINKNPRVIPKAKLTPIPPLLLKEDIETAIIVKTKEASGKLYLLCLTSK